MPFALFIYQCLVQLSLEKPSLRADGNTQRDPQSDIVHIQRETVRYSVINRMAP